jgi:VWFA-related protein
MKRLRLVVACGLLGAVAVEAQQPVFRATTDRVTIDVSVRRGRDPVRGLTSADFVLDDNGVLQEIDAISTDSLPVDVTLAMDLSGSVLGSINRFKSNITTIAKTLRPIDRLRLVVFSHGVLQVEAMRPATSPLVLDAIAPGAYTSMNDALFYALAWPADVERRHLVVAFTDGYDTSSMLDDERLGAIAARSDAVLHVVLAGERLQAVGTFLATGRASLVAAASRTGGAAHPLGDAVKSFKEVFDEFRTSYVLRYTLRGVKPEGWHDVTVKVIRPGSLTVRARRGYFGSAAR